MKRLIVISALTFFVSAQTASAATWANLSSSVSPGNASKVVAATDKLMSSEVGKTFPGKLLLLQAVANGADSTTHSFIPIYKNTADREGFVGKLQSDSAWAEFTGTLAKLSSPTSQVLNKAMKSWGDYSEDDKVWIGHAFQVSDPAAFLAALDELMKSPTGKSFPGQVYLSQTIAAGMSPVTHTISVGYASEVEMDEFTTKRDAGKDWQKYLEKSNKASDYLGASLSRAVKTWGPATFKDLAKP